MVGVTERSDLTPTPPFTVRGTAEVTWAGLVVVVTGKLVALETPVTVAVGLVVATRGVTTATGVLLDTDADTSGVVTEETRGVRVTAVPWTTPAEEVFGLSDLEICVTEDAVVDSATVALATLTTACTGVGVESVVGFVVVEVFAPVVLKDGALVVEVEVGKLGFTTDVTACGT